MGAASLRKKSKENTNENIDDALLVAAYSSEHYSFMGDVDRMILSPER